MSVDLPDPAVPTTASVPPAGTSRSTSRRTGRSGACANPTPRKRTPSGPSGSGVAGCAAARGRWAGCRRPAAPARPRAGLLPDRQQTGELAHRRDHAAEVGGEGEERADRQVPGEGQPAAEQQHPDLAEGRDRLQRRAVAGVVAHDAHPVGEQLTDRALEAGQFGGLLAEPLDHAHPRDGGLDAGGHLGRAGLRGGVGGEQVPAAAPGDPEQGRTGGQRHERQRWGQRRHDDERDDEQDGVAGDVGQPGQQALDELDVADRPADDLTGRERVELAAVHPLDGGVDVVAQVVLDVEGQPSRGVPADEPEGVDEQARGHEERGPRPQGPTRPAGRPMTSSTTWRTTSGTRAVTT